MSIRPTSPAASGVRPLLNALLLAMLGSAAWAATPEISNVPLSSTSTTTAKPNIMFILDDSGSMAWDFMPDDLADPNDAAVADDVYGALSAQCNGVAYNPAITYTPPVKIDATTGAVSNYANASFTAARSDGFNSLSGSTNLTGRFYFHYLGYLGSPPALSWRYASNGSVDTTTPFYKECLTLISRDANNIRIGNAKFEKRTMSATSTDAQNYANWYAYYRTRQLTMRSAAGRAFADLSDAYRVGFTRINHTGVTGTSFLNSSDFTTAQKSSFFNLLYTAGTSGNTPLRASLSKVGRYYGNVITGQTDPVQYSCQRNYAVLSTDGYWNSTAGSQLDGSAIGQQDGTEARPMRDGARTTITEVRIKEVGTQGVSTTPMNMTVTGNLVTVSTRGGGNCNSNEYRVRQRAASCTAPWTRTTTTVVSDVNKFTTLTVNGVRGITSSEPSSRNVTTQSIAPDCPTANWFTTSGTDNSSICRSQQFVTSRGYTIGGELYVASGAGTSVTAGASSTPASTPIDSDNTTTTTATTAGDSNSLADVAEYYWKTDLRTNNDDKSKNNVPTSGDDNAAHQHMTTFTIGLGLKGTLNYDRNYLTQTTGDFADLRSGAKTWPVPAGTLTTNDAENATHIDDLWHAAVNGRGQYFSAADPNQLDDAISTTLSAIRRVTESGAAAAASTLTPVSGDDWVFLPSFTTVDWTGDLRAFKFTFNAANELEAPNTTAGNEIWSASNQLIARTSARRILFNNGGALADFTYANLTTAGQNALFDNRCSRAISTPSANLSQCSTLTAPALAKVTGANLVSFLVGDRTLYQSAADTANRVFRTRNSPLGDFVNASPVYVGKPPFRYADTDYASFVSAKAGRTKMVYAAANDGMLHAFKVGSGAGDTTGGAELWAYVPSKVMGEMWRLADEGFGTDHRFFVDATPNVSDIFDSVAGHWRTILVGGLGAGGRGYYALDVTDPESPAMLWEFSDTNLGYTFGNTVITKDATGTWVVVFTSGTNNTGGGDGAGRLYVLNAVTGALIRTVATNDATGTNVGNTSTPNLGRLNAWINADSDNTAVRFYAGDMLGNLWRFDHDDRLAPPGREAVLLGRALAADGTAQPITGKPVLTEAAVIDGVKTPVVSFGTGRMLNLGDLSDTTLQSIYSIKDTLGENSLGVLRSTGAGLVKQTLNSTRGMDPVAPVDWSTKNGWFVDLAVSSKERVHLDGVQLAAGVLAFASTVPTADACSQGGVSFLYQFDLTNGNVLGTTAFSTMIVGLNRVMSVNGKVSAIVTTQDQKTSLAGGGSGSISPGNTVKRSSWRELTD
jgi:type IV pilus assembly protein PilY1